MKTVGIIAEYNPFHNGHAYQISEAKRRSGAERCIVVMSGDYVQRGEPAVFHKSLRAQMALQNGADIVFALPVRCSTANAEQFAKGAVSLLDALPVDCLCFGSECGSLSMLRAVANLFCAEPPRYQERLHSYLRSGDSYPRARQRAAADCLPSVSDASGALGEQPIEAVLSQPNNILAIEYLKALQKRGSAIEPFTIPRIGASYHSETPEAASPYASAAAIRRSLLARQDISPYIPEGCAALLSEKNGQTGQPLTADDFSDMLNYALYLHSDFHMFADVNEEISNRIRAEKTGFFPFHEWVQRLTSKTHTAARIRRTLLHIMLGIREEDPALESVPYARLLGIRSGCRASDIKYAANAAGISLLSRPSDGRKLTGSAARIFAEDVRAGDLYRYAYYRKYGFLYKSEMEQEIQTFPPHF